MPSRLNVSATPFASRTFGILRFFRTFRIFQIFRRFRPSCVVIILLGACGIGTEPIQAQLQTAQEQRVDQAIVRALEFLAREQKPTGAWQIERIGDSTAATSLAVMAFLAAGHVPGEGPYAEQLDRGIRWVIDHQESNGMLVHRKSHGPMYSHGISTLMLAEVVGMLDGSLATSSRQALERAVRLTLQAQAIPESNQHAGGWRD